MAEKPAFDPVAFGQSLARVYEGTDAGAEDPQPAFDPKLHKDVVDEATHGRSVDEYKQALDHFGFRYDPAGTVFNGVMQKEGIWRRLWPFGDLRMGFTAHDLLTMFRSAEDFDTWVRNTVLRAKLAAQGKKPPLLRLRGGRG